MVRAIDVQYTWFLLVCTVYMYILHKVRNVQETYFFDKKARFYPNVVSFLNDFKLTIIFLDSSAI